MTAYAIACALAALYTGCYAAYALKRRRFGALFGALLLAFLALAGGLACLVA